MNRQEPFRPDDKIGMSHFEIGRQLRRISLRDLGVVPTPFTQSTPLGSGRAPEANYLVELRLVALFKKQRDHHERTGSALETGLRHPGFPFLMNPRVQDLLKLIPS